MKNHTILSFLNRVLVTFAVSIIMLMILGFMFGDESSQISSIFVQGRVGLNYSTILQFLLISWIMTLIQFWVFSSKYFQHLLFVQKSFLMILCIMGPTILCIVLFEWFPVDNVEAWLGFFISFFVCTLAGIGIMSWKSKMDNKKYEELLKQYKDKQEEDASHVHHSIM